MKCQIFNCCNGRGESEVEISRPFDGRLGDSNNNMIMPKEKWNGLECYTPEETELYRKIHQHFIRELVYLLQLDKDIRLIEIGCGTGKLTSRILKNSTLGSKIKEIGVLDQKENVEIAARELQKMNNIPSIQAVSELMPAGLGQFHESDNLKTIVVSSGSLTKGVLTPEVACDAFSYLQKFADYVLVGGRSKSWITPEIAEKNGFRMHHQSIRDESGKKIRELNAEFSERLNEQNPELIVTVFKNSAPKALRSSPPSIFNIIE